jgi:hypothetical protein
MPDQYTPPQQEVSQTQALGFVVFFVVCGLAALEINGFGFGIPLTLQSALICATIGGAVGGVLICQRPWIAGLIGGLVAGPLGLLAVYYYTQHRQQVFHIELIFVQGIASLPGFALGSLIKKILAPPSTTNPPRFTPEG